MNNSVPGSGPAPYGVPRVVKSKKNKIEKFNGESFTLDWNTWIMIILGSLSLAYLLRSDFVSLKF